MRHFERKRHQELLAAAKSAVQQVTDPEGRAACESLLAVIEHLGAVTPEPFDARSLQMDYGR